MRVPSTASELAAEQVELPAEQHEGPEHRPEGRAVVAPEVGDGLEVGLQASQQPDHLDVAVGLGLQAPARAHPVEVAVDVELQQIGRIVARPARRLRHHAGEAGGREIQLVHEGLDEADRVVRAHVVVHRLGQEQKLRAVMSRQDVPWPRIPRRRLTRQKNQPGSHTVCMKYAQTLLAKSDRVAMRALKSEVSGLPAAVWRVRALLLQPRIATRLRLRQQCPHIY